MKIGLNLVQLTPGKVGGVETYISALIAALRDVGPEHALHLFTNYTYDASRHQDDPGVVIRNVIPSRRWYNIPYRGIRHLSKRLFEWDIVSARVDRSDVDVMHHPFSTVSPHTSRAPVTLTIHDIQHEYLPECFDARELLSRRRNYRRSAQRARRIIAISEFTRSTIVERYGIASKDITTIHYGVDHRRFGEQISDARLNTVKSRYGLPDSFVFYPANSWPHKNHSTLIAAWRLIREMAPAVHLKLVLAGVIYNSDKERIASEITRSGVSDDIIHIGHVPHADTAAIYKLARCMVFPSRYEGFGAPVLEAMASGCPVVSSTFGSLPEVAGNGAYLVDASSPSSIARGIYEVASSPELANALRQRGRNRAAQFSWNTAAAQTIEVYASASRENNPSRTS